EGVRVFDNVDKAYADELAANYLLTEKAIAGMITNYGDMIDLHGFQTPAWLPNGAADSSSVGLLGMVAYYRAHPNPTTADLIAKIVDGVAAYQIGNDQAYPFGMHPDVTNAPGYWHDWGSYQGQALVEAGMALKRQDWIDSAAKEANTFLIRQLVLERFREIGVVPNRLGQIAYGTDMIVQTYMALYRATDDENYAHYGGLAASWLFGNNMAGVQMYDLGTGRVFDGIEGPVAWRVNLNAGGESTIEGLLSLLAVADVPSAVSYLYAQPVSGVTYSVLEAESGKRINGQPFYYQGDWMGSSFISRGSYVGLGQGDQMELTFDIPVDGLYFVYVAHLRQTKNKPPQPPSIVRVTMPPMIDGKLDEWKGIPAINSNTREQFVRGVGQWKGPDVDGHTVQLSWDDNNLYLAVDVRAPQHQQNYTLSEVWHGEATWIYFASDPNKTSLSSKFTFAQTPDGPQVWDWINTGFLKDAHMVWSKTDSGFTYEASVPWSSIKMAHPEVGAKIGLEVGRSIGGNSFMDLTGRDPDVISNLLPVTLVDSLAPDEAVGGEQSPVFLSVQIADEKPLLVPTNVSPDSEYWWLDRVTRFPIRLTKGEYPLRYSYAGTEPEGLSKVDAFYIQPVQPQRVFKLSDGRIITLTYDTITGKITYQEHT
ncbi:MAG: sugar-binding protein, partial [Chloroflexota bacterium]